MSAEVVPWGFTAGCDYCAEWAELTTMNEEDAQAWADQHDAEYHKETP